MQAAPRAVEEVLGELRNVVIGVPRARLRQRAAEGTWSVLEYVCHLRDVFVTSTIRLHRAVTENAPVLEPMLNDLRARRFRYNERDIDAVLDDLAAAAAGLMDEVAEIASADWDRQVSRLPGEHRTARWLVRHAVHESRHHLHDIVYLANSVAEPGPVSAERA
jgi:hypothetical protein